MVFSEAKIDDASNFGWINLSRGLAKAFLPLLKRLTVAIHEREKLRERQDTTRGTMGALAVLLGNLLRTYQLDPTRYLAISLSPNEYKKGPLNPFGIGYRALFRVVDFLSNSDPPLVELRKGGHFKDHGFPTKLRATKALNQLLEAPSLEAIDQLTQRRTNNTSQEIDPQSVVIQNLFLEGKLPLLRLKNENKEVIEFEPTAETEGMQERGGSVFRDSLAAWLRRILGSITPPVSPLAVR